MNFPDIGGLLTRIFHRNTEIGDNHMTSSNGSSTTEPLLDLSKKIGPVIGLAVAAVGVATNLGVLNHKTSGFLNKGLTGAQVLIGLIPAVIAGFGAPLAAHVVATQGRELVTPVSSSQY
jgi:uncharacterized protein (DUF697 family)